MRVLFVTGYYVPAYIYGGPTRSVSALCEGLTKLGAEITVFTTDANGWERLNVPKKEPVSVNGVSVWYFPQAFPSSSYFYAPGISKALSAQSKNFDIIISESVWGDGLRITASECKREKKPYIVSLRGQLLPWSLGQKALKKRLYLLLFGCRYLNNATAIYCTTQFEADHVNRLGLDAPNFVVPNGLNTHRFQDMPDPEIFRNMNAIPNEALLLLFLGRLHSKKRPDIAIDALVTSRKFGINAYLLFAGPDEGNLEKKLRSRAEKHGCSEFVRFVGMLEGNDVLLPLSTADLLLMPSESNSENFGMSAIEAMASGVPVLVSEGVPVGAIAESVGAGRMVPTTSDAFSQASVELLSVPKKLKGMGRRGKMLAFQKFDINQVAKQMLRQYQAIIETGKPLSM